MNLFQRWRERREAKKREKVADFMAKLEGLTIDIQDGRMTVDAAFGGPPIKLFAAAMVAWFKQTGGRNYVTCWLTCTKTGDKYEITMQKAGGISPAEHIGELNSALLYWMPSFEDCLPPYREAWQRHHGLLQRSSQPPAAGGQVDS